MAKPWGPWRIIRWIVGLVVVAAMLAGLIVTCMLQSTPAHWSEQSARMEAIPQAQRLAMAQQIERDATSALEARGNSSRIRLESDAINAWLQTRLVSWLSHHGTSLPASVGIPQVTLQPGKVIVSTRIQNDTIQQIVTATFAIRQIDAQNMEVKLTQLLAGSLPLPVSKLADALRRGLPPDQQAFVDGLLKLSDGITTTTDLTLPGEDRPRQRLRELHIDADAIELTLDPLPAR